MTRTRPDLLDQVIQYCEQAAKDCGEGLEESTPEARLYYRGKEAGLREALRFCNTLRAVCCDDVPELPGL